MTTPDPHDIRPRGTPELLAPAGGPEALFAAVNNGADAVYLGMREFNARRGAPNFGPRELEEACRYAHLRGSRVYVTINVLIRDDEMADVLRLVDAAWVSGADAVIVQDPGLMAEVSRALPEVRMHASTQVDAHDTGTVARLAEWGVARVTLAREVSLEGIATIVGSAAVEIETFVHGALCFSHSGQCLLSSVVSGRSANRGLCAQPCRLAYSLLDDQGKAIPTEGAHLLSPRDLAALDLLPALMATGVSALKIEGRMKSPEYVALVTGVYRSALDRIVADGGSYEATAAEWAVLEEAFSRGFSPAHLVRVRDGAMMARRRPSDRGVALGRIVDVAADGAAVVALDRAAEAADSVEVWTSRGRVSQPVGPMNLEGREVFGAPAGSRVAVSLRGAASAGDRVFRVANASLLEAARRTMGANADAGRVEADVGVRVRVGEPLRVSMSARGILGEAEGGLVERARTKAITAAEIAEHAGRLGGSGFRAGSFDIDLDPSAGLDYSALHDVRRRAAEALAEMLGVPWASRAPRSPAPEPPRGRPCTPTGVELVVSAWSADVARAALGAGADRALVRIPEGETGPRLEPLLPRVAHDGELERLLDVAVAAGAATCGTLGSLAAARERHVRVDADWPLNAMNAWTAARLAEAGAALVWASPELSGRQLAAVVASSPVPIGTLAYGRVELMVSEHCVLSAAGGCAAGCGTCERRRGWWRVVDAKGYAFPVIADAWGRTHLANSVPLDLCRAMPEIVGAGVAAVRLEFTVEDPEEAARVTGAFRGALDVAADGVSTAAAGIVEPSTTGAFFRGVR